MDGVTRSCRGRLSNLILICLVPWMGFDPMISAHRFLGEQPPQSIFERRRPALFPDYLLHIR